MVTRDGFLSKNLYSSIYLILEGYVSVWRLLLFIVSSRAAR